MFKRYNCKLHIANLLGLSRVSDLLLYNLRRKYNNRYIRIINYHNTSIENIDSFRKQLLFFKRHFQNITMEDFQLFLEKGVLPLDDKPGIILTFDDGFLGNYEIGSDLLDEFGFTGYFMCSSDLIGFEKYMSSKNLIDLVRRGHVIGSHTSTHHRMREDDSPDILNYEIVQSKEKLESYIGREISIFAWCGGEEEFYTKKAFDLLRVAGYKYAMMTNSYPVLAGTNPYVLQRINVEAVWNINMVKFQICGIMDKWFENKRMRVSKKLLG